MGLPTSVMHDGPVICIRPSLNITRMSSASSITGQRVWVLLNTDGALLSPYRSSVDAMFASLSPSRYISGLDDLLTCSRAPHRRPDVPIPHLHRNTLLVGISDTSVTNIYDFVSPHVLFHACHRPTCTRFPQYITVFFLFGIPVIRSIHARYYVRRFRPYRSVPPQSCCILLLLFFPIQCTTAGT